MKKYNNQRGNVLFLILIAVALFAALSYAVTQSSRSGGDSSRETNILNAAQLTQYPTSVRTAVLRLVIDGFQDTGLLFNNPASAVGANEPFEIFATIGGGAVYQNAPGEMMQAGGINEDGEWAFNMNFEVPELGRTTVAGLSGNELIAFLPGVTESVCTRLNLEAGIIASANVVNPSTPAAVTQTLVEQNITALTYYASTSSVELDSATDDFTRQPFGCFTLSTGQHVFYTVILER